ncbi:MAG: hypothetical protein ABR953_04070 [Candidatus Acidiferrales bacterium]|jgi:hypothetical protein
MPLESEARLERAQTASGEDLKALVHETGEETLLALLTNPNLEEMHVTLLLERLDLPANVLAAVGGEGKWTASEGVRLRLARHPRTPKRIALTVMRQLYLFDLVKLSLLPSAPADIRRVAEGIIVSRVPHLPIGEKLTLARRGPPRVAGALLAEGHPQAVKLALANVFLTESQVLKVLSKPAIPERVVTAIARHPKWSRRYNVRAALVRYPLTPLPVVLEFLPDLTLRDLKDIAALEGLSHHLKKHIAREVARRAGEGELSER